MTGRVLIVDPVVTTRIVLKVKLAAAYFRVAHASSINDALKEVRKEAPDVVLCEYDLPDGGAVQLQRKLSGTRIPVIALLPEGAKSRRAEALANGLGDVISRPYDDRTLFARIRNLLRARTMRDELRMRSNTSAALGFSDRPSPFLRAGRIGLMAETRAEGESWRDALGKTMPLKADVLSPGELVAREANGGAYDALVVAVSGRSAQHRLDFVSSLRARPDGRHTAILAVSQEDTASLAITALDTGAGDVMAAGFEPTEAAERLKRLLKRRSEEQALRRSVEAGLEAAVTDPLTGLFNRRYAIPYLGRMSTEAEENKRCFAIMIVDLDFFKKVNDTHGHSTGDAVLMEFAKRLRKNVRSVDLVARFGGEEFLVAMPDTTLEQATSAARRLCELTRNDAFAKGRLPGGVRLSVSVGLALGGGTCRAALPGETGLAPTSSVPELLERADRALYEAKEAGRDTVQISRSAAA